MKTTDGIKVGDYFVSSWGYDQTNITFFKVLGVTAQSVRAQEVDNAHVGSSGIDDLVMPSDTPRRVRTWEGDDSVVRDAPIKTKRIRRYDDQVVFTWTDYANAYLWKSKGPARQTNPLYGH